jgi:NifU-like protein
MSLESLTTPFPWVSYSKKARHKLSTMRQAGFFTKEESEERKVFLAIGEEGSAKEGNWIRFYLLIDNEDGMCLDCRYCLFGQTALIAGAEAIAELAIGKNYVQLSRLSTDLVDRQLRDKQDRPGLPKEAHPHLNLCLDALLNALETCQGISLPESETVGSPLSLVKEEGYPHFASLSLKEKMRAIERVLDEDVRPYIALDNGGVELLNIKEPFEVLISYQGSCTSCFSAIGTTLSYIQQTLREKVHPEITVTPDIDANAFF